MEEHNLNNFILEKGIEKKETKEFNIIEEETEMSLKNKEMCKRRENIYNQLKEKYEK